MPKLQLDDLKDEDKQQLLEQAALLVQPKIPTGGVYHKMELDYKIYSVGSTIRFLHPVARFGTLNNNLPFIRMSTPSER